LFFQLFANGFAYDTAGLERQLRQCQQNCVSGLWEASACESAVGSGAATPDLSAVTIFDKVREFN
tara:strand:- start:1247 stop:1441 length:195 start_codon:yes stop_codon:yes gene_type:complete